MLTKLHYVLYAIFLLLPSLCHAIYPRPVQAQHAMVVSDQSIASQVGVEILKHGGNAIDAAVAVGYALAVVQPCCGNLGGGGFMLIHLANSKDIFLNFREQAPQQAKPEMFLNPQQAGKSTQGYLAVAIPGTVMGLNTALQKYGRLPLRTVIAPAIRLAAQGYILRAGDVINLNRKLDVIAQDPVARKIFLKNGHPYEIGDRLVQKDLAHTLQLIAQKGTQVFYSGPIAQAIVEASNQQGGILTLEDFKNYNIEERQPLRCNYRNYKITTAPPPSAGGMILCRMLNILQGYPLQQYGYGSAQSLHYLIDAMGSSFRDVTQKLGDPDFIKIDHPHTTHYSIMDKQGNKVAVTYTINSWFGAGVIAPHTGFFLNNEMDDFTTNPEGRNQYELKLGKNNMIQGGKRPLSFMTPTFVDPTNSQDPSLILGGPGGPAIPTEVLQTIVNVLDYGMDIQAAVDAPRIHFQGDPPLIRVEPLAINPDSKEKLTAMGYHFYEHHPWGSVQAIYQEHVQDKAYPLWGGSDNRDSTGAAYGY